MNGEDKPGGLLRYGIPNMKLEKQIIDRKIEIMKEEGIEFQIGCDVGKEIKPSEILKNYDRVVLACGASNPRDIKVPGRDAEGIYFAVDFLKSTTKALWANDMQLKDGTYISAKGKKVMVIGGGDTGNDCVGTSIRHGAKSVVQLEMMPKHRIRELHPIHGRNGRESARPIMASRRQSQFLVQIRVCIPQRSKNLSRIRKESCVRLFL